MSKLVLSLLCLSVKIVFGQYQETACKNINGICLYSWNCPRSNYVSGYCPTQSSSVKCCKAYQEPECAAIGGTCKYYANCAGESVSGKCPEQHSSIKCCTGSSSSGGCTDSTAKNYACNILNLRNNGRIKLLEKQVSGVNDGADSYSNIRDACNGKPAKRSSYENAPGGTVCLKRQLLQTMYDYAVQFYNRYRKPIQVNSIAGGSHSRTSQHYNGNTMDVQCNSPVNHCSALTNFCRARGTVSLCYPGSSCGDHETWVHCGMRF